jgi:hypothetical protein
MQELSLLLPGDDRLDHNLAHQFFSAVPSIHPAS